MAKTRADAFRWATKFVEEAFKDHPTKGTHWYHCLSCEEKFRRKRKPSQCPMCKSGEVAKGRGPQHVVVDPYF